MRTGNFLTLAQLLVSVFAFSACARATAVPPTSVAQVAATNTLVPPTATHTALPPTLTPTNTSTQTATVTNTFTPTRTNTPTVISSPTTTATSTLTPTEVPPTATRTATRKPATRVPPTATTAALAPLNVRQRTFEPRVAHDSIQKILGRQGAAIFVINNYNAPMTFTFPGNESMTALVTERVGYLPLDSVRNSPFTIPPGGWLLGIFNEGDIAWSAVISGVGQAQGGVTLSRAQDVELKFGN